MARGDSYQLQGQQGGVYLSGAQTATGSFRNIAALTATTITGMTSNLLLFFTTLNVRYAVQDVWLMLVL